MIVRGIVTNGGVTSGRDGRELLLKIDITEVDAIDGVATSFRSFYSPSQLRGLEATVVLHTAMQPIQLPDAASPADGDDARTVDDGDDAQPVVESMNG